ncbi:MAG: glycosyltransferase family 2 protein [Rhizomicrobium sp.]
MTEFTKSILPDTRLSVIVVTHNAREMTLRCLDSILGEIHDFEDEVIVVDNASGDEMAREMANGFSAFRVLPQDANLGFAAAANLGADSARGQYLLFLNPDTIMLSGSLDHLLQFAQIRPGAGIWGGLTVYGNGKPNPYSCRRRPTLWSLLCSALALDTRFPNSPWFAAMGYGGWDRNSERDVDVVCGCFLLVERALWDRLAGFSPRFYMYGEDEDLCLRARRIGYSPCFTPEASIIHHGSGTEPRQERKMSQILASRALLIRGYFPALVRPLATFLLMLRPLLGRRFGKRALRPLWASVWAGRQLWLAGRFPQL